MSDTKSSQKLIFIFLCINLRSTNVRGLRTCTVITPEFIHSARKFSISLGVNNVNTSTEFEVTIESTNFKNYQTIELQPNGVRIVEFDMPILLRDEYVLRVNGENGIHVHQSTLLKYAVFRPIFAIQTDKYLYKRGETLHYRILCMDENLKPKVPNRSIDIKIMTQDHTIAYHKRVSKFENYVITGELFLNGLEIFKKTSRQYAARLTVVVNNEILASLNFQIANDQRSESDNMNRQSNVLCKPQQFVHHALSNVTSNANSLVHRFFRVQLENGNQQSFLQQSKIANFKIVSSISFGFFVYTIIGRGNIVLSERVQLLENVKSYTFQLKPTNQMAPLAKMIVYFIDDNNEFHYDELMLNIEGVLENKITLFAPTSIQPNKKFQLSVITEPNSYIGLLAIESLVEDKFCSYHDNDLNKHNLLKHFGGSYLQRGEITGSIILTSAKKLDSKPRKYHKMWTDEDDNPFEITLEKWRQTWLFAEISNTTSHTELISHNLPNKDVTWRITAFALHAKEGLAFTQLRPSLRTKKSYNVTFDLPEFIYQNEVINFPLRIDNFLNEEINVRVEFIQNYYDIEVIPTSVNNTENIVVSQKSYKLLQYTMRSNSTGIKILPFLFFSTAGDDRKVVEINVQPPGMAVNENQYIFIDLYNSRNFHKEISPVESYNRSTMIEYPRVKTYADLLEPVLEFMSKQIDNQTADEAASLMAMTCLGLNYLESSFRHDTALVTKLLRNMHKSYLKLLEHRIYESGSYRRFPPPKSYAESIWLTAFVTNRLACVKNHIDIDETIIEHSLNYLAESQKADGSFPLEKGAYQNHVTDNSTLAITAHVLLAFVEHNKHYDLYKSTIESCINYIVENLESTESLYVKALCTYSLYKAGLQDIKKEMSKLENLSQMDDFYTFWGKRNDFEMMNAGTTSLVLLTAIGVSDNFLQKYKPSMKWLIEKGGIYNFNCRGVYPTHATVFAVEVLVRFMQRFYVVSKADFTLAYRGVFGTEYQEFELKKNVTEKHNSKLHNYLDNLEIDVVGQGYLLAIVAFDYHSLKKHNASQFEILIHRPSPAYMVSFVMRICVKYIGINEYADLTILEVNMPSGYAIPMEQLQKILENKYALKHVTMNPAGSEVKLYLGGLQRNNRECISMEPFRVHSIAKQVSVPIICYEYTNITNMAIFYYNIKPSNDVLRNE